MSREPIHIACAADQAYVPHAAAMLRSLIVRQAARPVQIHFLHGPALPTPQLETLRGMVEALGARILFHPIPDQRVADLPEMGRISRVMWYRVFLPELLPGVDRVLYLDCDTIVMDSLDALWDSDLGANYLGAVNNVFEPGRGVRAVHLGLKGPECYFNSGVLLFNLSAWREHDCAGRVLAFARANSARLAWPDQDALNVVMAGRWLALHPRWNCQNSLFYFAHARNVFGAEVTSAATRDPGILHFEGGALAKPWHYLCKHPYRGEYFAQRAGTPWPEVSIEGRTAVNRLLRPLPMPLLLPALKAVHRLQGAVQRRMGQRA
ncbi:MAG TPA: glycosyltransferase family 8 protein [Solimonas sp.]|nr:glycosyltransferase family 8 protein [Solimonas sp.]